MRDPERIDRILSHIGKIWKHSPDQRFFQLLAQIFGPFSTQYAPDFFGKEDGTTEEQLEKIINQGKKDVP